MDAFKPIRLESNETEKNNGNGGLYYLRGICALHNKIIISNWEHYKIVVFKQDGSLLHTFGCKGNEIGQFDEPCGLCVIDGDLWVADCGNKRIQIFNLTSWEHIICIPLGEYHPLAICSTLSGLILVSTSSGTILKLDHSGNIVGAFGSTGKQNGQFNCASSICCNNRNEIIVSDYGNHRIQIFSEDGEFLHTFGSYGMNSNQLSWPRGICTDWQDNIFVAYNNRISIFDFKGTPIQEIPICDPRLLCLVDNKMIVTSLDNPVQIFSN